MAKVLAWCALVALGVTLPTTWAAVWFEWDSASQFLELTQALLSWKVIAGGLLLGARTELKALLGRLAT
jgi:hypothetical protein